MTLATGTNRQQHAGNGSTKAFAFSYQYRAGADLRVILTVAGVETVQATPANYSVSPDGGDSGTVTFVTAPATGALVTIVCDEPVNQPLTVSTIQSFKSQGFQSGLDHLARIGRRAIDMASRSLRLRDSDVPGAGAYDVGGNRLTNLAASSDPSDAALAGEVALKAPIDSPVLVSPTLGASPAASDNSLLIPSTEWVNDAIAGAVATGVTDGDKGDIVVSGAGTVWTLDGGTAAALKERSTQTGEQAISTVTGLQSTLDGKQASLGFTPENTAHRGVANGYAGLDSAGKVPLEQINEALIGAGGGDVASLVSGFGGVGDDMANDTAAVSAAQAAGRTYLSAGIFKTSIDPHDLDGPFWGTGQIRDANNNLTAPNYAHIGAAPATFGSSDSPATAFNGDISKIQFPVVHYITGAATLGQPTSGYLYRPEAMPHYTYLYNESGHNQGTSSNGGRTGVAAYRTLVTHVGQGDAVAYNFSVFVSGAKPGATSWLANPAGVGINGEIIAGANGVYLNPVEINCVGGAYDAAAVGGVFNLARNVSTAALGAIWNGVRVQSIGSAEVDSAFMMTGKHYVGTDYVHADLGSRGAAIAMKANQYIYLNASADARSVKSRPTLNGEWIGVTGGAMVFGVADDGVLSLWANGAVFPKGVGFYNTAAVTTKPTVTGSRGSNAALTSLLTALATLGLITNSSS
jgi:hypothetical protein